MFFEYLLKLENDEKLWSFSLEDKIPIWLGIRFIVFWELQKEKFSLSEPHLKGDLKVFDILKYIVLSIIKNPWKIKKNKIVIFGAGINNVKENDSYLNKLYDLYIENDERFQLLESSVKFTYIRPRKNKNICYSDLFFILSKLISYLIKVSKEERKKIEDFLNYIKSKGLINENKTDYFKKLIIKTYKYNLSKYLIFKRFINDKKIRILILEDAHYGGNSVLIKLAKERSIPVIEMQHGYLGKGHLAYNFNREQFDIIKNYLPDYFFSFGKYWSERMRIPGKIFDIGNAYLEYKAENQKNQNSKKDIILIISGGSMPESYVLLSEKISKLFDQNFKILFRPHPSERLKLRERYSKILEFGIEVDTSNLYETLCKTAVVISYEISTVLYEALMFTNKVFLINNKYVSQYVYDELPFVVVDEIEELIIKMNQNNIVENKNITYIWEPGAITNFLKYIDYISKEKNVDHN